MLKDQRDREQFPGLLIFRGLQGVRYKAPLFVFVVGKLPTGGIRKTQFRRAVDILHAIRYFDSSQPDRLLILGPTTSGALLSLNEELLNPAVTLPAGTEMYVYSGTVTDAKSMAGFRNHPHRHFASFLENDDYASELFLQFACHNGYTPDQVAILSESETVYGLQHVSRPTRAGNPNGGGNTNPSQTALRGCGDKATAGAIEQLTFPREISYFRSAYQKQSESQSKPEVPISASANLTVDSEEIGIDDDAALPYAGAQTPPSQESVMLGIITQLEKRHTRFILLYASDPLDELFLAGYLRSKYPVGRVVITTPDLLLTSQENSLLRGVLGLNVYPLAVGLSDSLCQSQNSESGYHDRLFVSASNAGIFNATLALLNADELSPDNSTATGEEQFAKFSGYSTPVFAQPGDGNLYCEQRPLLWVTLLGRDGFWPVAGLTNEPMTSGDHKVPLLTFDTPENPSTLFVPPQRKWSVSLEPRSSSTPPAWRLAYAICLFFLVLHIYLTSTASILAESEARAQFTRTGEPRDVKVIALGALAIATAFVTLMFTRSPFVHWDNAGFTIALWFPFVVFLAATIWDLGWHRSDKWSVIVFVASLVLMFFCEWLAWHGIGTMFASAYWSTRILHLSSGVSPVLPILLLAAAGYWWMWNSLRGVTLVDLRRPRLPPQPNSQKIWSGIWHSISDAEADELRTTAHPLYVKGGITLSIAALGAMVLVLLDWQQPVQTIEGQLYDWFYAACLALMIVSLLSCLFKLLWTWSKCQQIFVRPRPIAFARCFWSHEAFVLVITLESGGSSMRATYKVMSRGIEDLESLYREFSDLTACVPDAVEKDAEVICEAAKQAREKRDEVRKTYEYIVDPSQYSILLPSAGKPVPCADQNKAKIGVTKWRSHKVAEWFRKVGAGEPRSKNKLLLDVEQHIRLQFADVAKLLRSKIQEQFWLDQLTDEIAALQQSMAGSAAVVMEKCLLPWWGTSKWPAVSSDDALPKKELEPLLAMAEEYVALIYINFLVTVLLRMRTLVITAIGVFVFILLSMNVYPFEPHPALQTLAVGLAIAMVAVIAYVYAKMHRDAILSLMTSGTPGELGWDFWLKLGSAVAIPVFGLLATQFPEINQFLFSWLEPALQAAK